jgi:hypothetical protein
MSVSACGVEIEDTARVVYLLDRWVDQTYQDLLTGSYDCIDRIVLNGYYRLGHDHAGFRVYGGGGLRVRMRTSTTITCA